MAELKDLKLAKATFETLCKALDNNKWNYKKDEENLTVKCGARGDDLPMDLVIEVDAERMVVILLSQIPFVFKEDKRIDAAIAVSAINNILAHGCFDYDVISGKMLFRMTNSFVDSKLGEEVFIYMLLASCKTVDDFNDKLLMLAKGMLSIEQFLSTLTN